MNTKFRVWDKERKEFLRSENIALTTDGAQVFLFDDLKTLDVNKNCCVDFYIDKYDICENDILIHNESDGYCELVYFDEEWLSWAIKNNWGYDAMMLSDYLDSVHDEYKIVGNVHENRELFFTKECVNSNNF